jgi:hypothetical protein
MADAMRRALPFLLCLVAAGCSAAPVGESADGMAAIARDPLIARALHDPLMSDPDLASRNEANAAIGMADSAALPVFAATPAEAAEGREALRLELLEAGPIPALPPPLPQAGSKARALGPMSPPVDLLAAVGAPESCVAGLFEDFALAASLPAPAAIPRLAMVVQAGGADRAGCALRIVRYTAAAPTEDLLHYHYARALGAGLVPARHSAPGPMIAAQGRGAERLAVHVRPAAHGLTGVTLVYRAP